jgi:hypothetical protein
MRFSRQPRFRTLEDKGDAHMDLSTTVDPAKLDAMVGRVVSDLSAGYGGRMVLGARAGEARLAGVFGKAGFTRFRRAFATPFNPIFEARL